MDDRNNTSGIAKKKPAALLKLNKHYSYTNVEAGQMS